jgi:hypothetical protein
MLAAVSSGCRHSKDCRMHVEQKSLNFEAIACLALLLTAILPAAAPAAANAAVPPTVRPVGVAPFDSFFAAFRKAVLAGDREAVAAMTHFPFVDARAGRSCEVGNEGCTVEPDSLGSRGRTEVLAKYDRIFKPATVAAIRAGRVRPFAPGGDDGEVPGPLVPGEYLLEAPDFEAQLVFVPWGGSWKLARIPFYS